MQVDSNPPSAGSGGANRQESMLRVYATWIEGTSDCDVAAIKRGIGRRSSHLARFAKFRAPGPALPNCSDIGFGSGQRFQLADT